VQRPHYGLPVKLDSVEGWTAGAAHEETGISVDPVR
jgi:hypothetical protein